MRFDHVLIRMFSSQPPIAPTRTSTVKEVNPMHLVAEVVASSPFYHRQTTTYVAYHPSRGLIRFDLSPSSMHKFPQVLFIRSLRM